MSGLVHWTDLCIESVGSDVVPIGPFNFAHNIGVESVNKLCGSFAFRRGFIGLLVRRRDDGDTGERDSHPARSSNCMLLESLSLALERATGTLRYESATGQIWRDRDRGEALYP